MPVLFIPSGESPYFIIGLVGIILLWLVLYRITVISPNFKSAITQTANTRGLTLFMLNLVIISIGISISVSAIPMSTGSANMTPEQINQLATSAQGLIHIVYLLFGVAIGLVLIWLGHLMIVSNRKKKEDEITISTKEITSTAKDIEQYKKVLDVLQGFFKGIHKE